MENTVEEAKTLPPRVAHVKVGEKDVYLVGTAHISKESVEDVPYDGRAGSAGVDLHRVVQGPPPGDDPGR